MLDFKLAKNIAYNYNPFFNNLALKCRNSAILIPELRPLME